MDYILWILLGLCVLSHLWMVRRGHGSCEEKKSSLKNDEHQKDHSCCH
ncbi:MAG: DUF2933 domain-containing protein [Candidatus Vogelbacteria bacterium]|nr:DUF2933 domain-containing protein [Candidatus Vogelbacteria bacterium]